MAAESVKRRRFEGVVVPIAEPSPSREVSLVHRRGHLRQRIVGALGASIGRRLPDDLPRARSKRLRVLSLMGQFR
jgi:hypothetical protein